MTVTIYIDHNVWDYLFEKDVDLLSELPATKYVLAITREAEFEIPPTPDAKRQYITKALEACSVEARPYFGFFEDDHPANEQRVAGLDEGYFASAREVEFIESQRSRLSSEKKSKTRLFKNEADISLAARSFDSIVLTFDKKAGPLKDAFDLGGNVIYLESAQVTGLSIGTVVELHVKAHGLA